MNELIDYKKHVQELCDRGIAVIEKAEFSDVARELKAVTDEILQKTAPSLMFYGIYNAGKSSIINAIFAEDIAAVGDVPTTQDVQEISWHNFKIIDTPGINAQNEHTLIARKEIEKNDVVLFVVADENIEERSFYNALVEVLKGDSKVLIVLNQKDASYSLSNSDEVKMFKNRIIELIRAASKNAGLKCELQSNRNFQGIIPVNAWTARLSQHKTGNDAVLLYNESNLDELITRMQSILDDSNGVRMLCPAISSAEKALRSVSERIREKVGSASEKNYYNTRDNIKRQKEDLYQRLVTEGRMRISEFRNTLLAAVETNGISESDITSFNSELNEVIQRGFREANITLQKQYDLYAVNLGRTNIGKDDFKLVLPKIENDNTENSFIPDSKAAASIVDTFAGIGNSVVMPPIPKLPPVDPKNIAKILGVIFTIFKNKKQKEDEERKRNEALIEECNRHNQEIEAGINERINQILEVNQRVNAEMDKLNRSFKATVSQSIEAAYAPILEALDAEFDQARQKSEETNALLLEMNSILHDLSQIKAAISV